MLANVPAIGGLCYSLLNGCSAISSDAQTVRKRKEAIAEHVENSQFLFGAKGAALAKLLELQSECADSTPLNPIALLNAGALIRALPDTIAMPEFASEPDGSIALDWIASKTRFLTVSVGDSSRLAYAWLDGTEKGHAVALFDGAKVPDRIAVQIRYILPSNYATAPLRAA
jgi:hypothetical protein